MKRKDSCTKSFSNFNKQRNQWLWAGTSLRDLSLLVQVNSGCDWRCRSRNFKCGGVRFDRNSNTLDSFGAHGLYETNGFHFANYIHRVLLVRCI